MSRHLTAGQHALLEAALVQRQHQLDGQLEAHQQGLSRAEHAREWLQAEGHDAPEREADRTLDLALSDREIRELGEVSAALRRLRGEGFGLCTDCEAEIPFDRLKAEPWALRCIDCEGQRERAARLTGGP
jgi:DnaK suppressor protein